MENAVQALKIAFAVMMFALALALSISSFSSARTSIDVIMNLKDSRTQYSYIDSSEKIKVGIEKVIPTLYSAYYENFKVVFLDSAGLPLPLYYALDTDGEIKKDENGSYITINTIDLESEVHLSKTEAIKHLSMILGKKEDADEKYQNEFKYEDGLYKELEKYKFVEYLGEYYQEDAMAGEETDALEINKTKKRVITYQVTN